MSLETQNNLYLLGGTWGMNADGNLHGEGFLDDAKLLTMQRGAGILILDNPNLADAELAFSKRLYDIFRTRLGVALRVEDVFANTCPELTQYFKGSIFKLFSFDSSHKGPMVTVPLTLALIEQAIRNPNLNLCAATGTDNVDREELLLYDTLTFDSGIAPLVQTGARMSIHEDGSDAQGNLITLGKIATQRRLSSGGYWISDETCFRACDIAKIDPDEGRSIEGQRTFFAPHGSQVSIDQLPVDNRSSSDTGILDHINLKRLFLALNSVYTIDLGSQNSIMSLVEQALHSNVKGIVVAGHGLGNGSYQMKELLSEAHKRGKKVVVTSRCLIPQTTDRYGASLLAENYISGGKLNPAISRCLLARAIMMELDVNESRELFEAYRLSRGLV